MIKSSAFIFLFAITLRLHAQSGADVIIVNARIETMDSSNPRATALAITGNQFSAVGYAREVMKRKSPKTVIIDAKGKTIIPGLFDSHLHVIRGGRFYNAELRWDGVKTLKRALAMLKEQAGRTPKGQWVRVVGGWSEYQFEERRLPTLAEINEATGDVPAFILYLYGKAWLNRAGLNELKIDHTTPNPAGGLIEKDDNGMPTGLLVAEPNAFILYSTLARLPELSQEERINSTIRYMSELNRLGVTAVMDAGGGFQNFPNDYEITAQLDKEGKITLRLPYFLFAQKRGTEFDDYSTWTQMVEIHHFEKNDSDKADYYAAGAGENLVADAADFENFLYPRPDLPATLESNLKSVLELLIKKRWPFRIHATYNESITRDLDVIEEINKTTPLNDLVWFIDHAETISEENMKRIKTLGGGIAVQHRMAYQGESFVHRYGSRAAASTPPVKKMLELQLPVGLGTDGTRVASYNPWAALFWITTGRTVGNTQVMAKESVLDRYTALKLFTEGGYALIHQHDTKGKIKVGFGADLAILSDDYFSVTDDAIKDITSLLTVVDGKVVWGNPDFYEHSPTQMPAIPSWSPVNYYGGYQTR